MKAKLLDWYNRHSTLAILIVPLVVVAGVIALFGSPLLVNIFTALCINIILVLGLQVFMGNSGILAWTHVGFMGIGAFAASIFSMPPDIKAMAAPNMYPALMAIDLPVIPALLLGALVAVAVAALVSYPLMRLSDAAGVITFFAMLIVIHVVLTQWDNVTNGPRTFFGVENFTTLWVAVVVTIVTVIIAYYFRDSKLGLKLRASRDDRFAAAAIGINVVRVRYLSFLLSVFIAGLGGGLWAHFITAFSPKSFYLTETFSLLIMLVIGGPGSVSGAFLGTVIVTVVRELLRQMENLINTSGWLSSEFFGFTEIFLAIFLILVLIWRPNGIIGGAELRRKLRLPRRSKEPCSTQEGV